MSSVELTEIYLERMNRYDPELMFAVSILADRAREEAQQADMDLRNGQWRGPLHGIPFGVKDLFTVTGTRTTWGSDSFADQRIDEDSDLVVRLREAGAVLIAKLATAAYLAPIVTGVRLLSDPRRIGTHRIAAYGTLGLTILTAITGCWMVIASL